MGNQRLDIVRKNIQNTILDLEKIYMKELYDVVTSDSFIKDLKSLEEVTQEYYVELQDTWDKKNKIKDASERLLTFHILNRFNVVSFYPSPVSCDIAIELDDIILNVDVKTIDKIGNSGEINTTQFEHNQTSFENKNLYACPPFPGFKIQANLKTIDPRSGKPVLTFLVKIVYSDNSKGNFNICNTNKTPTIVLTCLPNGSLSNLFDYDLVTNFKNYIYYTKTAGSYYEPKYITNLDSYTCLSSDEAKYRIIESNNEIPDYWVRIKANSKVGYYDTRNQNVWFTVNRKSGSHKNMMLEAVKFGDTARFNDQFLEIRYDSQDSEWCGQIKIYSLLD